MNKARLREYALILRKNLSYNKLELESDVLNIIGEYKNIAIYYPMKYEIDLLFLKKYNLNLIYPKVVGRDLIFYKNPTKFIKSNFNVYEPLDGDIIPLNNIDIMFVPSLVISSKLYRIGYGKGFYDRTMKNRSFKAYGLCYKELYLDFLEEEQDERLDGVIICKP